MLDQAFPHRSYLGGKPVIRVRQQFCRVHVTHTVGLPSLKFWHNNVLLHHHLQIKRTINVSNWPMSQKGSQSQTPISRLFPFFQDWFGLESMQNESEGISFFFRQMKVWGGIVAVWQMRLGGLARHSRTPDISRHCQIKRPQTLEQVCSVKKWRIPARWQPPLTCDQCCKYVDRIGEIIRFHSPRSSYTLHILKHHKLKGQVNWVVFPIA